MNVVAPLASACPFPNASRDFRPYDLSDPYPFYAYARAEAPVFYSEEIGYWVVARHADVRAVLEDWRTYSSENTQAPLNPLGPQAKQVMRDGDFTAYSGLSGRNPPEHTRLRPLVQTCFGPKRFRAIEPQIRAIVNHAIDGFAERGHADLYREFCYDVPAQALFRLIGIPDSDVPKVKAWSLSRAVLTWGDLSHEQQIPHARNMVEYWNYCRDLVKRRHADPTDDLPGDLVRMQKAGADISDDEIAGVNYSALFAGHETTTTLMANGLTSLLGHRDAWQAIVADKAKIPAAIDECLRYSPSIVAWRRKALKDVTIGDKAIPAGATILLLLGSANRDETTFQAPDAFDLARKDARLHLAFGYGIHACVGQQLAKLEFNIALEELTRRLPSLRLSADGARKFVRNISFRVPSSVYAEWDVVAN
jgi:cytochrome P450